MAQERDDEGYDRVDGHTGRGGAAMVTRQTDDGELIVLRHADRTMPLLYTHLIPATYGGRARMNVANALAAAAAAWAAGAHMHDIRQGLRTFSTSFFQAPGRLNQVPIDGYRVILDYCHNVDGMRRLAEFVGLMMNGRDGAARDGRAIGVIGIPGDRRDEDHREYGRLAAHAFNEIIVREDRNRRGRKPGESAELVKQGVEKGMAEAGGVCTVVKVVLDEQDAATTGMEDANRGDLVMLCSDDIAAVYRRIMADAKAHGVPAIADPGELTADFG
jgi:cyanophycin synthetase